MDVPGVPGGYLMGPIRLNLYKMIVSMDLSDKDLPGVISRYSDVVRMAMALESPPTTWLLIDSTEHFLWDFDYWFANLPEVVLT